MPARSSASKGQPSSTKGRRWADSYCDTRKRQKGPCWGCPHYSQDRVPPPLKRAGERGEGKWKRVSWDEALPDSADAMLDAIQEVGPESIIHISTPAHGGFMAGLLNSRLMNALGGLHHDDQAEIN